MSDVTRILNAIEEGQHESSEELLPLVYEELRRMAHHKMANEQAGQTLQATALVHEAYLRLVGKEGQKWNSRGHFFCAAAEAMRRILVERARQKKCEKHGKGQAPLRLDDVDVAINLIDDDRLIMVDEALEKLADRDEIGAKLVKLRFFAGMTNLEAARLLGVPERTAKRTWSYARAWLYREIKKQSEI